MTTDTLNLIKRSSLAIIALALLVVVLVGQEAHATLQSNASAAGVEVDSTNSAGGFLILGDNMMFFDTTDLSQRGISIDNDGDLVFKVIDAAQNVTETKLLGGDAATRELDNLQNVAINTALLPDTDRAFNFGSSILRWDQGFFSENGISIGSDGDSAQISFNTVLDAIEFSQSLKVDNGLTVNGSLTYVDGNQQAGRIMISDANGNASWADAPAGAGTVTLVQSTDNSISVTNGNTTPDLSVEADNVIIDTFVSGAGVVTNADSVESAIEKLDGNISNLTTTVGNNSTNITNNTNDIADKANRELDNLQNVAINTSLLPGINNTIDLGSSTLRFRDAFIGPASVHIGLDGDEVALSYDTLNDQMQINQSLNVSNGDIILSAGNIELSPGATVDGLDPSTLITEEEILVLPTNANEITASLDLTDINGSGIQANTITLVSKAVAGNIEINISLDAGLTPTSFTINGTTTSFGGANPPAPTSLANAFTIPKQAFSFYMDGNQIKLINVDPFNLPTPSFDEKPISVQIATL